MNFMERLHNKSVPTYLTVAINSLFAHQLLFFPNMNKNK